jgi:hypothetical protein
MQYNCRHILRGSGRKKSWQFRHLREFIGCIARHPAYVTVYQLPLSAPKANPKPDREEKPPTEEDIFFLKSEEDPPKKK